MWADTGDVDPVLSRMLHLLRHHWESDPDDACTLSELSGVVAGTRGDDALSRRRALYVVDRALRRDLPQLLRTGPRERSSATLAAAASLEQLTALEDSRAAGCAVSLTFNLGRRADGVDRRMIEVSWEAARHAENALFEHRTYKLSSAAVSACRMFVVRRADLAELGSRWTTARELARRLACAIIHEAAHQQSGNNGHEPT
jgi:hypothetical protein